MTRTKLPVGKSTKRGPAMKISDLTVEEVLEKVNLMKQLRIARSIIEMAKELGVKRTELMKYINEHPKNINWNVYRTKRGEVAVVTGVFLDPRENPLTEEYAEERKKEHWISLGRILYEGWVCGFEPLKKNSWENQDEDMEKYRTLPGVGQQRFALGYAMGSHYSDWHDLAVKPCDFNKMVEEGHKMGLRFKIGDLFDREVNTLDDMPDDHFSSR